MFHCDEPLIYQHSDVLHHSVNRQISGICDCFVAEMTLVRAAVLTAEQVGVDRDWSVTKIQIKILCCREKTFPVVSGVQVGSRLQVIPGRPLVAQPFGYSFFS